MNQNVANDCSATAWEIHSRKVLLGFALLSALVAGSVCAETLQQVVETALRQHPKVKVAAAQQRAAAQDITQARGSYFPTVDINLAEGRERTDSPDTRAAGTNEPTLTRGERGVVVSQKLFDGMATSSEVQRLTARNNVALSRLAEVREEVAFRTVQVYLEVLKSRQLVKLSNDSLKTHLGTQDKVQQRVTGGVSQRSDLQQAQGRVALSKSTASARAGQLREAEANYRSVVGRPAGDLEDPTAKMSGMLTAGSVNRAQLLQTIQQSSDAALTTSPTLSAAMAEIAAAEAQVRGAKAPYYPRLNLELSANRNRNIAGTEGDFDTEALMLVLRWNLFRGGSDRAQEKAFVERRFAAIETASDVRRELEERVAVALHAKATSEERLAFLREHASLSAEVLEAYNQQLDLGRRTLLDTLNAENELFTALSNLAAGRYDDLLNYYAVEAAKGQLVKTLGVAVD